LRERPTVDRIVSAMCFAGAFREVDFVTFVSPQALLTTGRARRGGSARVSIENDFQ